MKFEDYDQLIAESKKYLWYVSSLGYIFSICKKTKERKILSKWKKGNSVTTKAGGKEYQLNQLVAKVFLREWYKGSFVLNIDGNIFNNNVRNLEVISRSEFIRRLDSTSRSMPVVIKNRISKEVNRYRSVREAAKTLFVSYQTLSDYLNGNSNNSVLSEVYELDISYERPGN